MTTRKNQSQASLQEQLEALVHVANREGLYDASDWLAARVKEMKTCPTGCCELERGHEGPHWSRW